MRGTVAKRLRRAIYGNESLRDRDHYRTSTGQVLCDPVRRKYKQAKRTYVRGDA